MDQLINALRQALGEWMTSDDAPAGESIKWAVAVKAFEDMTSEARGNREESLKTWRARYWGERRTPENTHRIG